MGIFSHFCTDLFPLPSKALLLAHCGAVQLTGGPAGSVVLAASTCIDPSILALTTAVNVSTTASPSTEHVTIRISVPDGDMVVIIRDNPSEFLSFLDGLVVDVGTVVNVTITVRA